MEELMTKPSKKNLISVSSFLVLEMGMYEAFARVGVIIIVGKVLLANYSWYKSIYNKIMELI